MLTVMGGLQKLDSLESEVRRFARGDRRRQALETTFGVGPILASHPVAGIGDAHHFHCAANSSCAGSLVPVVIESADSKRSAASPSRVTTRETGWESGRSASCG
jgi:transposase